MEVVLRSCLRTVLNSEVRAPATGTSLAKVKCILYTDPDPHYMNEFPKLSEQKFSFDHISVVDPDSRGQN